MFGECHAHLFMDGKNYREAVARHKNGVDTEQVKNVLKEYQKAGVTFIRDGGDAYGVSKKAKELAPEYGIDYRTPLFAIHRNSHYGKIVGYGFDSMKEYRQLIAEVRRQRGDFIKIMISGIMDYREYGLLSEEPLDAEEIRELIHIAHEEGFAVMVHANGDAPVLAAVRAGADSIEHGNYVGEECIRAMAEENCAWVPTIVTTKNLLGCGRYDDAVLRQIYRMECENLAKAYQAGVQLALGSDAGAYLVPHAKAVGQEYEIFRQVLGTRGEEKLRRHLQQGEDAIRERFRV